MSAATPRTPPPAVPAAPSSPDYGRWTVAPSGGAGQGSAIGLQGCTHERLAKLSGAAYDACARQLADAARRAPGLPPTAGPRNPKEQAQAAYRAAVKAWRDSPQDMSPHPCPPDDTPRGKLVVDKCSLVNAARHDAIPFGKDRPAVEVRFKIRF